MALGASLLPEREDIDAIVLNNAAMLAARQPKRTVVLVVALAFFIFTSLGTVIIPIMPHVLTRQLDLPESYVFPLFAAGPFVQLVFAPLLGKLVDTHGPFWPLLIAFGILGACAALFGGALAFVPHTVQPVDFLDAIDASGSGEAGSGEATMSVGARHTIYGCLVLSRAMQGLSSATIISGGLALVSSTHPDEERGGASGTAMSGLALGALSPIIGGFFAQAAGLAAPFYTLGGLVLLDAALLICLRPMLPASTATAPPFDAAATPTAAFKRPLWRHPSAFIVGATIATGNLACSLTEPLAPLWLGNGPLQYESGLQGLIFGAATVSYFIMTPLAGQCADTRRRRVPQLVAGLCVNALGLCLLGLAPWAGTLADQGDRAQIAFHSVPVIAAGLSLIGAGLALIDTPSLPLLSSLAEEHGEAGFGEAGAVQSTAFAIGQTLGPLLSLPLVYAFDAATTAPWLADGLAPSAFPAAALHLAMVPLLIIFVKAPEPHTSPAGSYATDPLQAGSINSP